MAQSGWRLPDELLRRVRVRCAESGERQNAWVERALESALDDVEFRTPLGSVPPGTPLPESFPSDEELVAAKKVLQATGKPPVWVRPTSPEVEAQAEVARARGARQRALNEAKLKK